MPQNPRDGRGNTIIIYSADVRQETQSKLSEMRVQAFLVKPKGLDELITTIERLII